MNRSRSLLRILSDPNFLDPSKKNKDERTKTTKQDVQQNLRSRKQDSSFNEDVKNEVDCTKLSSQEAKQLSKIRLNEAQLNKNMSEYELNQLLKMQRQILQYEENHKMISEKISDTFVEENNEIIPKLNYEFVDSKHTKKKQLVYPKIMRSQTKEYEDTYYLDNSIQIHQRDQENTFKDSKIRSITDYGEREKKWPGKYPLYCKNIDKINLSCQYLKFKQECINKIEEKCQIYNQKHVITTHQIYNQLAKQQSANSIITFQNNTQEKELPSIIQEPFKTVSSFNVGTRKIGMAEFQSDFSNQELHQQQKQKNLQQNIYNQLIQQKLKLNQAKKQNLQNKEILLQTLPPHSDQQLQNKIENKSEQQNQNAIKLHVLNHLPQLLLNRQDQTIAQSNQDGGKNRTETSPQEERVKKVNNIMKIKIEKRKKLRQSQSLVQVNQHKKAIQHIDDSFRQLDKQQGLTQYKEQLKTLNESIKKQLQYQLQLKQPSLSQNKKKKKNNENNIVPFLHKSDTPFYNIAYYKIDMQSNSLQKIYKNPNYTLHEQVNQDLKTNNQFGNTLLPPITSQFNQKFDVKPLSTIKQSEQQVKQQKMQNSQKNDEITPTRGRKVIKYLQQRSSMSSQNRNKIKDNNILTSPLISNNQKEECLFIQEQNLDPINKNEFNLFQEVPEQLQIKRDNLNLNEKSQNNMSNLQEREEVRDNRRVQKSNKQELYQNQENKQQLSNMQWDTNLNSLKNQQNQQQIQSNYNTNQTNPNDNYLQTTLSKQDNQKQQLDNQFIENSNTRSHNIQEIKMFATMPIKKNNRFIHQHCQNNKQLRFQTDPDKVVIEEEDDYSFNELLNTKFNGVFNDSLYEEHIIKNIFNKISHETLNTSFLSENNKGEK